MDNSMRRTTVDQVSSSLTVEEYINNDPENAFPEPNIYTIMENRPIQLIKMQQETIQRISPQQWQVDDLNEGLFMFLYNFAKTLQREDFRELEIFFYMPKQITGIPYTRMKKAVCELAQPYIKQSQIPWKVLTHIWIPSFIHQISIRASGIYPEIPSWNGKGFIKDYYEEVYLFTINGDFESPEFWARREAIRNMVRKLKEDGFFYAYEKLMVAGIDTGTYENKPVEQDKLMQVFERIDLKHAARRAIGEPIVTSTEKSMSKNQHDSPIGQNKTNDNQHQQPTNADTTILPSQFNPTYHHDNILYSNYFNDFTSDQIHFESYGLNTGFANKNCINHDYAYADTSYQVQNNWHHLKYENTPQTLRRSEKETKERKNQKCMLYTNLEYLSEPGVISDNNELKTVKKQNKKVANQKKSRGKKKLVSKKSTF